MINGKNKISLKGTWQQKHANFATNYPKKVTEIDRSPPVAFHIISSACGL